LCYTSSSSVESDVASLRMQADFVENSSQRKEIVLDGISVLFVDTSPFSSKREKKRGIENACCKHVLTATHLRGRLRENYMKYIC